MRKFQKEQLLKSVATISDAHDEINMYLNNRNIGIASDLLIQCQEAAIKMGELIEKLEGEGFITVSYLEEYCETIFAIHGELQSGNADNPHKIFKKLNKSIIKITNSIKNDIHIKYVAVFLPYKASMWDSLESVWMAADRDPDCDAYVIPIPYYDLQNGKRTMLHYEADMYPDYVPIIDFNVFNFEGVRPDMIFIHNPYDNWNTVTSVPEFFYSANLKKFTDCLVYIPYYATSGGMGEGQAMLPAYINADYIVIQSKNIRGFFDKRIPDEKFLAFGSPKFDSVINKCKNPPEPPAEWKENIYDKNGNKRKVYFYNTSIAGMLENTKQFLDKVEYVIESFKDRDDLCLLWRPHPLLESTFDSMRPEFKERYLEIKNSFIEGRQGIFDTTPHIEDTIAISDTYIGDAGTSVTSLFGVVGKPMFILDNNITTLPTEDDWKGMMLQGYLQTLDGVYHNKYYVTYNNKLFYSPNDDMHFEYFCDLSEYSSGGYYQRAFDYEDKIYVFPANAEDIIVISQDKKMRKIRLNHEVEQGGAFAGFRIYKDYAYILPNRYSSLIRFNLKTEEVTYLSGVSDFNIKVMPDMERIPAARWIWRDKIYFMNPDGTKLLIINTDTLETTIEDINIGRFITGLGIKEINGEEAWLIPYEGTIVTRWNLVTGETRDYDLDLGNITTIHRMYKHETNVRIFGSLAWHDNDVIFGPNWGDKFVKLSPNTGTIEKWDFPLDISAKDASQYLINRGIGGFEIDICDFSKYTFVYLPNRKIYDIDLYTKEMKERPQFFKKEDVFNYTDGYGKASQWLRYSCMENLFNTIQDELNGTIHGGDFNKEEQIKAYTDVNASPEGDCGEKVISFLKRK